MGVKEIRPVGTVENVFKLNKQLKDSVLIRECHGKKCEGFLRPKIHTEKENTNLPQNIRY